MATRKRPEVEGMRNVAAFLSQSIEAPEAFPTDTVDITKIKLPAKQPRRYFDPQKLAQLTQSIQEHGILEPLLVRPLADGNYELIAGERRLKAAQKLNLSRVPVISRPFSNKEALQVALMENLQREDLNPIEETEAVLELLAITLEVNQSSVVSLLHRANHARNRDKNLEDNVILQIEKVNKMLASIGRFTAESFRVNRLPLLNLPEEILESLRQGQLEYTKARAIARIKDEDSRKAILKETVKKSLSLVQIKDCIKQIGESTPTESKPQSNSDRLAAASRQLKKLKTLSDLKKQRRLEKLLSELELLLKDNI